MDNSRWHLFTRQSAQAHMLLDFFPDGRQSVREGDNMLVFGAFAYLTKAHVISVLLAAFRVSPGRLNVAIGEKAYPDVRPRRRNRERLDPLEQILFRELRAVDAQ
jgi:hypothetical protein